VEASPDSLSQDKYRFASDVAMVRAAMNENESPGLTLAIGKSELHRTMRVSWDLRTTWKASSSPQFSISNVSPYAHCTVQRTPALWPKASAISSSDSARLSPTAWTLRSALSAFLKLMIEIHVVATREMTRIMVCAQEAISPAVIELPPFPHASKNFCQLASRGLHPQTSSLDVSKRYS